MHQLCTIIRRIDRDVHELKGQHVNCTNLRKTVDELAALCTAAMVAAGTKLHRDIAEQQKASGANTSERQQDMSESDDTSTASSPSVQTEKLRHAESSLRTTDAAKDRHR